MVNKLLIDLHVHSTASDGSYPPAEVVRLAGEQGLTAIALTDHDTIDGVPEALTAGEALGVEVIPGVEISAQFPEGNMHILGYFVDHRSGILAERLAVLKKARADRNPRIIAQLNDLEIPITLEQVKKVSGGGQIGRPHIARALLEGGYVLSIQEAFDIYLRQGGLAYASKFRFPPAEAIAMIQEAQGIPVLSHPFTLGLTDPHELRAILEDLIPLGLAGLEVFYAEHTPEQETQYLKLAQKLDLLITGGSDFHGLNKPDVQLGRIPCQNKLTYDLLDALKSYRHEVYGV